MAPPSITCPRCRTVSYNPNDVRYGYCGRCRWWTSDPTGVLNEPAILERLEALSRLQPQWRGYEPHAVIFDEIDEMHPGTHHLPVLVICVAIGGMAAALVGLLHDVGLISLRWTWALFLPAGIGAMLLSAWLFDQRKRRDRAVVLDRSAEAPPYS